MAKRAPGSQSAGYHYNATPKKPAPTKTPTVAPPPSEAAKGPAGDYRGASADYVTAVEALPPKAQAVTEKATVRASRKRVRAQRAKVRALTKPKAPKAKNASLRVKAPKPYKAPKLPSTKPVKFQGKVTAGTPSLKELKSARVAGELKVNKAGALTTPKIRRVSRKLAKAKVAVRKSQPSTKGLQPAEKAVVPLVRKAHRKYPDIPKSVLMAQIKQESGFNPEADSGVAKGLSQFIESTAKEYGVKYGSGRKEQQSQVTGQAHYLHNLGFAHDPQAALSGYSGGYAASDYNNPVLEDAKASYSALDKPGNPKAQKRLVKAKAQARSVGLKAATSPREQHINYLKTFGKQVGKELKLVKAGKLSSGPGKIVQDSGVSISEGHEPEIVARLKLLSAKIGKPIYIISGYRSPQHSVEVGGFANDPHTKGEAADIGVGSPSLESAGSISEAQYESVGLHRPFYPESAHEINHVQLLNGGTPATGSSSGATSAGSLSSGAIAAYASASGSSPAAVRKALKTKKLTAAQIFKKLERLGVGVSNPTVTQTKARGTASPTSELSRLEAKYGSAT